MRVEDIVGKCSFLVLEAIEYCYQIPNKIKIYRTAKTNAYL